MLRCCGSTHVQSQGRTYPAGALGGRRLHRARFDLVKSNLGAQRPAATLLPHTRFFFEEEVHLAVTK